jgi:hypothetical protein
MKHSDKWFYAAATCAMFLFFAVFFVAMHLDNLEEAEQHNKFQAKQWAKFIDTCRPSAYDRLGRAVQLSCPVNPTKE